MNHVGTRPIETERLVLRRMTVADALDAFDNWLSDPEVALYMQWDAQTDVEQAKQYIEKMFVGKYENNTFYRWAIALKTDNAVIGSVGFEIHSERDSVADVSYGLCKRFWNQGIMSEALTAVIDYAFREVGVNRIEAFHAAANPASGRVMQKTGMKLEGHARQKYRSHKGFEDCDLYAILRDDYNFK